MKGFSLIELIFVLIIIGVLSVIGAGYIYNGENVLLSDANVLKQKLLEKRSNALGFMADMNKEDEKNSVCLKINKDDLSKDSDKVKYIFKSTINSPWDILCFDSFGRIYHDEVNISNLIHNEFNITLKTEDNNKKILTVYPISGYVKVW
ncbi:type II secretion system protein [Caminibacter sp.]